MHEIAEFLQQHPPFDTLEPEALAELAAACEIEFAAAGTVILAQAVQAPGHAWVVRRGAVELLDGTRVVDLLGEGEMFGHASLLSEWPTALAVRAVEDTLCYRIPAEALRPALARPAALRFAARSLSGRYEVRMRQLDPVATAAVDPSRRRLGELVRGDPLIASADTSVRDAAGRMVEHGSSSLLVELGDGYGIVTDRDLRERVVAAGAPAETPLRDVMTDPAITIAADATGADALLEMLDRGIRHLPVVDERRRVIGVISDTDLLAVETRTPFHLRRAMARASDVDEVVAAMAPLPDTIVALHDAKVAAVVDRSDDRHRSRRAHPPPDRAGRGRAGPAAAALHLAGAGQRRPPRGVSQLRPGQRHRLGGRRRRPRRGRAPDHARPSGWWRASSAAASPPAPTARWRRAGCSCGRSAAGDRWPAPGWTTPTRRRR